MPTQTLMFVPAMPSILCQTIGISMLRSRASLSNHLATLPQSGLQSDLEEESDSMEQEQLGTCSSSISMAPIDDSNMRKIKQSSHSKFPLTFLELAGASCVFLCFAVGLTGVYLTLPDSDYSFLKLPRTIEDLHILRYSISHTTFV